MILCDVCLIPASMVDASEEPYHYFCLEHYQEWMDDKYGIEIPEERLAILYD